MLASFPVISADLRRPARERWRLEAEFALEHKGKSHVVPRGFCFDLASIPRPAWILCAPFELSITAPLLHDYLYRLRIGTRAEADRLFLELMRREGVGRVRSQGAYLAVRLLGGRAWRAA